MPINVYASLLLPLGIVDVATIWIFSPHCNFVFFGSIIVNIGGNVRQPCTRFNKFVIILSCVVRNCVDWCLLCYSLHLRSYSTFLLFASLELCGKVRKNPNFNFEFFSSSISSSIWMHLKVSHITLFVFYLFLVALALW